MHNFMSLFRVSLAFCLLLSASRGEAAFVPHPLTEEGQSDLSRPGPNKRENTLEESNAYPVTISIQELGASVGASITPSEPHPRPLQELDNTLKISSSDAIITGTGASPIEDLTDLTRILSLGNPGTIPTVTCRGAIITGTDAPSIKLHNPGTISTVTGSATVITGTGMSAIEVFSPTVARILSVSNPGAISTVTDYDTILAGTDATSIKLHNPLTSACILCNKNDDKISTGATTAAISLTSTFLTLHNNGTIRGNVVGGPAGATIMNLGIMSGAVITPKGEMDNQPGSTVELGSRQVQYAMDKVIFSGFYNTTLAGSGGFEVEAATTNLGHIYAQNVTSAFFNHTLIHVHTNGTAIEEGMIWKLWYGNTTSLHVEEIQAVSEDWFWEVWQQGKEIFLKALRQGR